MNVDERTVPPGSDRSSSIAGLLRDRTAAFGGAAPDEDEPVEEDGRRYRRQRNRASVVDALLDLYHDGNLRPSSAEIAERAGLSSRSLFRYFDDVDDLMRAAVRRQQHRAAPLIPVDVPAGATLEARVAAVVDQRFALFDAVAPAATVSRIQSPFQPLLLAELTQSRAYLRNQLAEVFDPELAALGARRAPLALSAIDVACSFESYQLLRNDQALPPATAKAVMADAVAALLAGHEPGAAAAHTGTGEAGTGAP